MPWLDHQLEFTLQGANRTAAVAVRNGYNTADAYCVARGTLHNNSPRHSEIATPKFGNRKKNRFFQNDNRFLEKKTKLTSLVISIDSVGLLVVINHCIETKSWCLELVSNHSNGYYDAELEGSQLII